MPDASPLPPPPPLLITLLPTLFFRINKLPAFFKIRNAAPLIKKVYDTNSVKYNYFLFRSTCTGCLYEVFPSVSFHSNHNSKSQEK